MNPRIRELAKQAGYGSRWNTTEQFEKFMEKFAELLVRECAGACLHDDWEDPRWGRFYANKIKEHFGVK